MYRNIYGHIRTSWDLIQTDKPDIVLVNKQHKHSCSGPQTKQHQRKKKTHTKKKKKVHKKYQRLWEDLEKDAGSKGNGRAGRDWLIKGCEAEIRRVAPTDS